MRTDKEKAFLKRKKGKSYGEISKIMKIPKSTLSLWFRDDAFSQVIRENLKQEARKNAKVHIEKINKRRGILLAQAYKQARSEAEKEIVFLKKIPLFVAGLSIYWGEGEKTTKHFVRVSNIDPSLLFVFKKFLTNICGIPESDIRCSLLLYPDLEERTCLQYWTKKLQLKNAHFRKSTRIQGRHKTKKISYGICIMTVGSSYLKEKMMIWLAKLPQELLN